MSNVVYPRSCRETMDGWIHLPRYLDKIRLHLAGKLSPDYQTNLGKGFDGLWLETAGVNAEQFIEVVRKGRGKRLKETPDMFSGLMWSGTKSIELGLADGYGSLESVARDVIKAEDIHDYPVQPNLAEKFAKRFGAEFAQGLASALTQFGLR